MRAVGREVGAVRWRRWCCPAAALTPRSSFAPLATWLQLCFANHECTPSPYQVVLLPFGRDKSELDDYSRYTGPPEGKALQR